MEQASGLAWPVARLADAVELLARASGLVVHESAARRAAAGLAAGGDAMDGRVERLSRSLDFEVESSDVMHAGVIAVLEKAAPAVIKVPGEHEDAFIAVLSSSRRTLKLLRPDGRRQRVLLVTVASWLRHQLEAPVVDEVNRLLVDARVPEANRLAARQALLDARLGSLAATRCWMLRPAIAAPLWRHMRHARLPRRIVVFLLTYAAAALASAGSWWLIGAAALEGLFDAGTLLAWSFLLLSVVPLGLFAMWSQGVFMIGVSGILKLQLLAGALKLDPDETRHQGAGRHLARVIESESLEALALAGGFYAFTGLFDLLLAVAVLVGTGRTDQLRLVLLLILCLAGAVWAYIRRRVRWTDTRLHLTHDLVERMSGHRTMLVQDPSGSHDEEDDALERYVEQSRRMDRVAVALSAIPRAWMLAGVVGLAAEFVAATSSAGPLAVGLGVTLLVYGALAKLTASLATLTDAAISWRQVRPLLEALRRPEELGHVEMAGDPIRGTQAPQSGALIAGQDVVFQFGNRAAAVLQRASFRIGARDRIHLSGASGSGKSTLVSLLTGVRMPASGLLLLAGLDRATLGTRLWRKRVAGAPQFHENHVFSDTLAFNLLMARRWPPTAEDLDWAAVVCKRLGLDALIARMPQGLFQVVGDGGWQLSHGECSRIFMARALLQGADLVVLDESFAELDPENLMLCLREARDLTKSILVVAHT